MSYKKKKNIYFLNMMILNCITLLIFAENIPVITLSDLKEIVKDPANSPDRVKKIEILKKKIDNILEDGHYDCDDIFLDHDYAESTSFDCIVYYLAGFAIQFCLTKY